MTLPRRPTMRRMDRLNVERGTVPMKGGDNRIASNKSEGCVFKATLPPEQQAA